MVTEYTKPVLELVRTTVNNREGMKKVVDATEKAINQIDQDVAELVSQRHNLVTIHRQYVALYEVLMGEELRSRQQIQEITRTPGEVYQMEMLREKILDYAESCGTNVRDDEIVSSIGLFPWKNPKAVIATILLRSGKWKKQEPGVYAKIEEEQ